MSGTVLSTSLLGLPHAASPKGSGSRSYYFTDEETDA